MKKIGPLAYSLILLVLLCSGTVLIKGDSPEKLIVGKWEEVAWDFERINVDSTKLDGKLLSYQKKELYNNMMIHQAEEWEFYPKKELTLKPKDLSETKKVKWFLKGRGNILELKYGNNAVESYQLHKLTKDTMVIYYNFDLQMRGSVKITFKKVQEKDYAQKI